MSVLILDVLAVAGGVRELLREAENASSVVPAWASVNLRKHPTAFPLIRSIVLNRALILLHPQRCPSYEPCLPHQLL